MLLKIVTFGYDKIICHLSEEEAFVKDVVKCVDTASGRPTSKDSLERLRDQLEEVCSSLPLVGRGTDRIGCMGSLARFQFGEGGECLIEGCSVVGNYPYLRIIEENTQVAMLTPERGMLSLTMRGGEKLLPRDINWVEMEDFVLEGNLFAVGVKDADRRIRSGDDVLVVKNGELEAVGVASMGGEEMIEAERGEAVRIRHNRKTSPGD
jgi:archaeosine synthase